MKLALLILAHSRPQLLARLVSRLSHPDWDVYIHLDKKCRRDAYRQVNVVSERVQFLDDPTHCAHGGYSLVQAERRMLEHAHSKGRYQYYMLLSGQDYPIKPLEAIEAFLEANYPTNFLKFWELTDKRPERQHLLQYYYVDAIHRSRRPIRQLIRLYQRCMNRLRPPRKFLPGMKLFRGSQWLCITDEVCDYVLRFSVTDEGRRYWKYFRRTWGSDEMAFHNIVLNSEYAAKCKGYDQWLQDHHRWPRDGIHYIDWDRSRENPAILDMRDFDRMIQSDKLFARKFDLGRSDEVLDRIDREIG